MTKVVALDLGLVVASHGRHYTVETPEGKRLTCHPRGKKSDCVVGDRVRWMPTGSDEGVIEHLEAARNLLFRQDEWKTKSFAANLDQLLVLVAANPVFSESQLARALIAAEQRGHRGAHRAQQGRPAAVRCRARTTGALRRDGHRRDRDGAESRPRGARAKLAQPAGTARRRWCWVRAARARAR